MLDYIFPVLSLVNSYLYVGVKRISFNPNGRYISMCLYTKKLQVMTRLLDFSNIQRSLLNRGEPNCIFHIQNIIVGFRFVFTVRLDGVGYLSITVSNKPYSPGSLPVTLYKGGDYKSSGFK